jgi:hypothetical protein
MDDSSGGLSAAHFGILFLVFLIMAAVTVVVMLWPAAKILKKMGYSGWWCLLYFVPFGVIIGLWVLATSKWPLEERAGAAPTLGKSDA